MEVVDGNGILGHLPNTCWEKASKLPPNCFSPGSNSEDFSCDDCGIVAPNLQVYFYHRRKHNRSYASLRTLHRMSKSKCPTCNGFHLTELKRLLFESHDSSPEICNICDKIFFTEKSYSDHLQKSHQVCGFSDEETFSCCFCYMHLESKDDFKTHLRSHDVLGSFVLELCQKYVLECNCFHCGVKSASLKGLFKHCKDVHSTKQFLRCPMCSDTFSKLHLLRIHVKAHKGRSLNKCRFCLKILTSKAALKHHEMRHIGGHPFSCGQCGKSFSIKCKFQRHLQSHNPDRKQFKCDVCNKAFSSAIYLKYHTMFHNGGFPYECQHCGKGFARPSMYNRHIQRHTPTETRKKFHCQLCGKGYVGKNSLQYHQNVHCVKRPYSSESCSGNFADLTTHLDTYNGTIKDPITCEVCFRVFTTKQSLKYHKYTHTGEKPFPCNDCSKSFRSASDLKAHVKINHDSEALRPYHCDLCDQKYWNKQNLKWHKVSHSGVKSFSCEGCGKRFIRRYNLQGHLKTHDKCRSIEKSRTKFESIENSLY